LVEVVVKGLLNAARSEFADRLVSKGMSRAKGFCWTQLESGFKVIVEPRLSYRHGVLFGCALGLYSWRHQEIIDRILKDLERGILSVRDGYDGIWYPYFTFGAEWYGFVDGIYQYIYLPEDMEECKKACAERADFVVDSLMPQLDEFGTVEMLPKMSALAMYAGGPIDLALPILAAFDSRFDDMDRLLDRTKLRGTSLARDCYPIFCKRLVAFCESGVIPRVLSCASKDELVDVQWPEF
jgi:hypothetical protein